jgi:hypothetical protein
MLSGLLLHAPEFELFAGLLEAGLLLGCLPMIDLLIYDNVSEVSRYLGQGSTLTATSPLLSRIYLVTSEPSELVIQKVERRSNRSLLDGGKGRRCYVLREESNAGLGTFLFFFFCNDSKSKQLSRYKSFGSRKRYYHREQAAYRFSVLPSCHDDCVCHAFTSSSIYLKHGLRDSLQTQPFHHILLPRSPNVRPLCIFLQ